MPSLATCRDEVVGTGRDGGGEKVVRRRRWKKLESDVSLGREM